MKRMFKKTATIASIALIFMMTMLQSTTVPTIVSAAELNQDGFVDSFTLEPTDLNHGDDARIAVEFSDKSGGNMKSGDTLTLQVPENLEAFTTSIDLIDGSGQNIGTCEFPTISQVVCTFNDTVEKLKNIRGNFFFTVTAGAVESGTTVDYETNLGTNLAKKGYSITSAEAGTDPGVFFYKTGVMQPSDPNHAQWWLNANLKKEHLNSDIKIKDEIGAGQELVEDSFSIMIEDHNNQLKTISKEEFVEQQYGEINITNEGNFDVTINQSKASVTSFSIMYKTKITEAGKKLDQFDNTFETEYTVVNEDPVKESGVHQVNNRFGGGGGVGDNLPPVGTVRVVKTLDNNEEIPLENVTFNIFKADGTPVENGLGVITDAEGKVEITDLAPGDYYAQEISAPDYVDFDPDKKIEFTVESDATEGIELPINNDIKTTDISVTKVWEGISEYFPEITINLLVGDEQIDSITLTEGKTKHTFTNLETHTEKGEEIEYTVTEEVVEGFDSEVTGNIENGFTVTNTKQGTEVEYKDFDITKSWFDGDGSDRPDSIEVQLIQGEDKVYETATITAKDDWKHTFKDVPMNDENGNEFEYTIKELPVPGYATEVDGFDITNTKVGIVDVGGTKTWKDNDSKDRPESIIVQLLANGEEVDSIEVTAETDWKYAFAGLDAYDSDGKAIEYTIDELKIDGYEVEVNGYNLTNTLIPVDPEKPVEPEEEPADPEKPVEPEEEPADPEKPVEPEEEPTDPEKPVEPEEEPTDPEKPVEPEEELTDPEKPVEPEEEPTEPTEPGKPETEKEDSTKGGEGSQLPSTATNIFNLSLIGIGLMLVGLSLLYVRRKKV